MLAVAAMLTVMQEVLDGFKKASFSNRSRLPCCSG